MRLKGASVVPFFRHEGVIYLILARERANENWSGGMRWSGFGGSAMPHETAACTATREFCEESMDMPCYTNLKEDLCAENVDLKLVSYSGRHYYVTYVKEISCDWETCLRHVSKVRQNIATIAQCWGEDTDLTQISVCAGDQICNETVRDFQRQRTRDAAKSDLAAICPSMTPNNLHDVALEKDVIACWSLSELHHALNGAARQTFRR